MKRKIYLLISLLLLVLTSCSISEEDKIESVMWKLIGDDYYQLTINDPKEHNKSHWFGFTDYNLAEMNTVEADVIKKSGSEYYGYGISFCHQDMDNYKFLIIDTTGYYRLGENNNNGNYSYATEWNYSSSLKKGFNQENRLKIILDGSAFDIYFNNTFVRSVSVNSFNTSHTSGFPGFYANIGDEESISFPENKEDFRFRFNIIE